MVQILQQILEQHAGSMTRSTVLQPVLYFAAIVGAVLVGASQAGIPEWIIYTLAALFVGIAVIFGCGFLYFMKRNPDALRSEKFNITKLAIERGVIGDKTMGNILTSEDVRTLPSAPDDEVAK